jgi:hypothetical protein
MHVSNSMNGPIGFGLTTDAQLVSLRDDPAQWITEEANRASLYGICDRCGTPRDVRTTWQAEIGSSVMELFCPGCGPTSGAHDLNCQPELGNPCSYCVWAKTT